jgi:sulfate permease, SulP family
MMKSKTVATDSSINAVTAFNELKSSSVCSSAAVPSVEIPSSHQQSDGAGIVMHVLYGLINATMVLPITMSFGSIIYRDDAFAPYRPVLVKLVIASGVIHQLCFTTFSTLPFCVGQVQDAGLIFLSVMASNIVSYCHAQNSDEATLLATVTVGLSVATALLGCGLLLVGHWRWAQYMQLLPTWYVEW